MLMKRPGLDGESDVTFLGVIGSHGRLWNLYSDGTLLPLIAGGADDDDDDDDDDAGGDDKLKLTPEQQAEVDRIIGRRVKESERAAVKKVAEQLGMTPAEAVKFIAEKKAADEDAKTEEQKRLDELAKRERNAEDRDRKAAERERSASVREALAEAGAIGQELKDAAVLIVAELADDADADAIQTAVDDLKKRREELFKGATPGSTGHNTDTGSGGGGGGGGAGGDATKSAEKLKAGADQMRKLGIVKDTDKKTA